MAEVEGRPESNFSFGEADQKLLNNFKESELFQSPRVEVLNSLSLEELRDKMILHADKFLGNDSGPGHLAANLGIPLKLVFVGQTKPCGNQPDPG